MKNKGHDLVKYVKEDAKGRAKHINAVRAAAVEGYQQITVNGDDPLPVVTPADKAHK